MVEALGMITGLGSTLPYQLGIFNYSAPGFFYGASD